MFLHPSRDIDVLKSRFDVVQFCVDPKNEDIVKNMLVCLKDIKSITVRFLYNFLFLWFQVDVCPKAMFLNLFS
jgi:hypothetical protein